MIKGLQFAIAIVTTLAYFYQLVLYGKLCRLAGAAGYPVSRFPIKQNVRPYINAMIQNEVSKEKKDQLVKLKEKARLASIFTFTGFIALIIIGVTQSW